MDQFLKDLGLKVAANQKFGIVGLRWAALQAGLGIVRRNNFFYTESGSWVHLEAWLTDKDMEQKEVPALPACPKGCNRCITSCPTKSLSEPYTMLPNTCISFLTTFGGRDLVNEPMRKKLGQCIYGCDICQDVCPMNKGKWEEEVDFPGLQKLAFDLTPEKIMEMDEDFYRKNVQPKFFYLSPEELWKWKVNVLSFMGNNYKDSYKPYILAACNQENEKIREMAEAIRKEMLE
jgi:epoxyqueuosine reductase QueG